MTTAGVVRPASSSSVRARCEGQMMAVAQIQASLKFELLIPVRSVEKPTACMSFNYHRDHFGIAWDIGIFKSGAYLGESPLYDKAAEVGLSADLEWGGHWKKFKDKPHYQLATELMLASVRGKFEEGQAIV